MSIIKPYDHMQMAIIFQNYCLVLFYKNNKVSLVSMQLIDGKLKWVSLSIKTSRMRVLTSIYLN